MPRHDVIDPRPENQDHHEPENDDDGLGQLGGLGDLALFPGLAELFLGRVFGPSLVLGGEELEVIETVEEELVAPPVVFAVMCLYFYHNIFSRP